MRRTLLALGVALAIAVPAQAAHCTTWSTSVTNDEMIVLDLQGDTLLGIRYIVNDLCQDDASDEGDPNDPYDGSGPCLFSIWLYFESNGIPGLQRGDEVVDDSCHWMIEPDYFVW